MKKIMSCIVFGFTIFTFSEFFVYSQKTQFNKFENKKFRDKTDEKIQLNKTISNNSGSPDAPLLFAIGMHIEPLGKGKTAPTSSTKRKNQRILDYNDPTCFQKGVNNIIELVSIIEKHNGKLVIQTQTPFTNQVKETNSTLLSNLEAKGHEIGLHFHENDQMGDNSESLPIETWTKVLKKEIDIIKATGVQNVRYWSGGNLYPHILDAASKAGLEFMGDYKDRRTQKTDESLLTIFPWRPAGSPNKGNITQFAQHNPSGEIIYLPTGMRPKRIFNRNKDKKPSGNKDSLAFDRLTEQLELSLKSARKDRINVFHITVHPGQFRGKFITNKPYEVIDLWLTEIIDPLVESGKVRWATFSEMADAYKAWENTGIVIETKPIAPEETQPKALESNPHKEKANITFVINVHDFRNINKSADTLIRLVDIFDKYKVKGDFYLTAPILHLYEEKRPEAIEKLLKTKMTISYHTRPPHPLQKQFDQKLKDLNKQELISVLQDYEKYKLDLSTGELIKDQPGGYRYVKDIFGTAPVTIGISNMNPMIKTTAISIYKQLGAKMLVGYHGFGADIDNPFEYKYGLLIRPSDFSISSVSQTNRTRWWNMVDKTNANENTPLSILKRQLSEWNENRAPFITSLMHEATFYLKDAAPCTLIYYTDKTKKEAKQPPYDLNAPDISKPRTEKNQKAIWAAFEEVVAYSAKNLNVITSKDIVEEK